MAVLPDALAIKMVDWNVLEVLPPLLVTLASDDVDGDLDLNHSLHMDDIFLIE